MAYDVRGSIFSRETITVSTTAIGPTIATSAPSSGPARGVVVNPVTQDIRFTCDGTTPTASLGIRIAAGDTVVIYGESNVNNLKMIREDASDSSVELAYLR